jgi:uncharacterized protein YigE (DUF2233 family)
LLTVALGVCGASNALAELKWQRLGNGLETTEIRVNNSFIFPPSVYFYRSNLKNFSIEALSAERYGATRLSAKEFAIKSGATLTVNANYFNEVGRALGLVVSSTKQLSTIHKAGSALTGIFLVKTGIPSILDRSRYSVIGAPSMAVQAGPRLLSEGKALRVEAEERARRAGVCIDHKLRVVFFIAPSSFRGITLKELQAVLQRPEINCYDALNFDGGGSAQIFVKGVGQPNISWQGQDDVPVAVGLVAR